MCLQAALDKTDDDRTAMSALLAYLNANEIISDEQTRKGFDRLYEVHISARACLSRRVVFHRVLVACRDHRQPCFLGADGFMKSPVAPLQLG